METKMEINEQTNLYTFAGWLFGLLVFAAGIANLFLVHPVPGIAYLLLSFIYFPPTNVLIRKSLGFRIPMLIKIILGVALFMFTLGVSDLGNMIDKL